MEHDAPGPAGRRIETEQVAWLAAIVQSCDDAIIGETPDGTVTSWNAGGPGDVRLPADEITGHSIAERIPPDRPGELPEILAKLASGERIAALPDRRLRKDGTVIDVSVSVSPVRDAAGRLTGFATVARDITDQLRAADQICSTRSRPPRPAVETVGQLAAGVAHDFNNMLGAIACFADLIRTGEDPGDARDDAQHILAAVDRASSLTKELLLVFGRRAVTNPQRTDLNAIITGARPLINASLGPGTTLAVNLGTDPPAVWADAGQLEQAH